MKLRSLLFGITAFITASIGASFSVSAQQPCQWNYTFVNGVATATFCGNVNATAITQGGICPTIESIGVLKINPAALNTAAWQAFLATWTTGNKCFQLGPGTYQGNFNTTLPSPTSKLSLFGSGQEITNLSYPTGSGLQITLDGFGSSVDIANMTFLTGTASGSTNGLLLTQPSPSTNPALNALSHISNVSFHGSDGIGQSDYWGAGINLNGVSSVLMDNVNVFGASTSLGIGISVAGQDSTHHAGQLVLSHSTLKYLALGEGQNDYTEGVVWQTDHCIGVVTCFNTYAGTDYDYTAIFNSDLDCLAAASSTACVNIQGTVPSFQFNGNYLTNIRQNIIGLQIAVPYYGTVNDNIFNGETLTSTTGLVVATPQSAGTGITGTGNTLQQLAVGLNLDSTSGNIFTGNLFTGNTTNVVSSGSTNNQLVNNIGYNPVGNSGPITVGTSPATICAGFSPETHYFLQSATNTATINLGSGSGPLVGETTSTTIPIAVDLSPNECEVVTWTTTAPTYTKSIH